MPSSHWYHLLIDRVLSGLNIIRWNTFPRVREVTALDHLVFVAHVSILFALETQGRYDLWKILRKILFGGFFTFYYSDMSSEMKYRIREKDPKMIESLEKKMIQDILREFPDSRFALDFASTFTPSPEDDVIAFAKSWASYYEVYNNSLVFPDAYTKLLKNIENRALGFEIPEISEYFDFDPHNQTSWEKFLLMIHRLASSFRWNQSSRTIPVSVLSHTYIITFVTYLIGISEDFSDADITDMMLTALYHDIPEAITGDVITPTKKAIPWLEWVIESVEHDMVHDYLLSYLSDRPYLHILEAKMLSPWKEENGSLVKLADHISAYYEAKIESPSSQAFFLMAEKIRKRIEEYEDSADYIANIVH